MHRTTRWLVDGTRSIRHHPVMRARLLPWTIPVVLLLAGLAWDAGGMWLYGIVVLFGLGAMFVLGRGADRGDDHEIS